MTKRDELTNRIDLLQEIVATLRQERNFWLRQKDFKRVASIRQRLKSAEERLSSCLHYLPNAA